MISAMNGMLISISIKPELKFISNCKSVTLSSTCTCGLPDIYDNMVQCENVKCSNWYHYSCVNMDVSPNKDIQWFCNNCSK